MPGVLSKECGENPALSHIYIAVMMLQWFNDDKWYHSVRQQSHHFFDCNKDNSKRHWRTHSAQQLQIWAI